MLSYFFNFPQRYKKFPIYANFLTKKHKKSYILVLNGKVSNFLTSFIYTGDPAFLCPLRPNRIRTLYFLSCSGHLLGVFSLFPSARIHAGFFYVHYVGCHPALTSSLASECYLDIGSADHHLHKISLFLPIYLHIPFFCCTFVPTKI